MKGSATDRGWIISTQSGAAADICARDLDPRPGRQVVLFDVDRPAVVLGSSQRSSILDGTAIRRSGLDVAVRRSGGGVVVVRPGDALWVDVLLPAGDELWDDDIRSAPLWLGRAWHSALGALGVASEVHSGPPRNGRWGRAVCMAGLAPGEVTVGGRKAIGLAQRRTRDSVRFQSVALLAWDPGEVVSLLAVGEPERAALAQELTTAATALPVAAAEMTRALIEALP